MAKIWVISFVLLFNTFLSAQTIDHPTINNLDVSYKESTNGLADSIVMVRSQSYITLKSDSNVTELHFKIRSKSDNSIIYQADYLSSSGTVTNSDGVILFKKEPLSFYIATPNEIPLTVYIYEITTENTHGISSEVYSALK